MAGRGPWWRWMPVFVALAIPAPVMQARVFSVAGGGGGDLFQPGSFGPQVYAAAMQINGARADVSVVACEGGVASIREAFATLSPGGQGRYQQGETLGCGVASKAGNTVRLVTLAPDSGGRVLMVAVTQTDSESRAAPAAMVRHVLGDVPVPPGATVLSTMQNGDTRTTLERVSARQPREGLLRFYEGAMPRGGWVRVSRPATGEGLLVFVKGSDLCCIRVGAEDSNGESQVTLLHKPGAVN